MGGSEKRSDSCYVSKVELAGFADDLNVAYERKK